MAVWVVAIRSGGGGPWVARAATPRGAAGLGVVFPARGHSVGRGRARWRGRAGRCTGAALPWGEGVVRRVGGWVAPRRSPGFGRWSRGTIRLRREFAAGVVFVLAAVSEEAEVLAVWAQAQLLMIGRRGEHDRLCSYIFYVFSNT